MNVSEPGFIASLQAAATEAQQEEIRFRDNVGAEIARRERDRQFAYRRLGLARAMARAASAAETEEAAVAAQGAALRRELGWFGESEQRTRVLQAWEAVGRAVWRSVKPREDADATQEETPSVADAMAAFEAWYLATFGTSYLTLLDQDMPEMPVVEF